MKTSALDIPSLKDEVSPEEWAARVDLAAAYRACALFGLDDLIWTHISTRVPGSEEQLLFNPYGLLFDEISASSLVKIDLQGNKVLDSPFPVNPAGVNIHSAIQAARVDVRCVLHTHSVNGAAVSAQQGGMLPLSQPSRMILASLAYHDYEGPALNADEKPRLVADLGQAYHLILRNHGLITVGETVADAFIRAYRLEQACAIQIRAQAGGGALVHIREDVLATARGLKRPGSGLGVRLVWPAILRRLDRLDPSFRD